MESSMRMEGSETNQNASQSTNLVKVSGLSSIVSTATSSAPVDTVVNDNEGGCLDGRTIEKLLGRRYPRLIIDYDGLVELGWPYGKTQTFRLMEPKEVKRSLKKDGTWKEW